MIAGVNTGESNAANNTGVGNQGLASSSGNNSQKKGDAKVTIKGTNNTSAVNAVAKAVSGGVTAKADRNYGTLGAQKLGSIAAFAATRIGTNVVKGGDKTLLKNGQEILAGVYEYLKEQKATAPELRAFVQRVETLASEQVYRVTGAAQYNDERRVQAREALESGALAVFDGEERSTGAIYEIVETVGTAHLALDRVNDQYAVREAGSSEWVTLDHGRTATSFEESGFAPTNAVVDGAGFLVLWENSETDALLVWDVGSGGELVSEGDNNFFEPVDTKQANEFRADDKSSIQTVETAGAVHLGIDLATNLFVIRKSGGGRWTTIADSGTTVAGLRNQGWEATKVDANGSGYTIFLERDNGDTIEWSIDKDGVFQGTKNFEEDTVVITEQAGTAHLGVDQSINFFVVRKNASSKWIPIAEDRATVTEWNDRGWNATKAEANGSSFTVTLKHTEGREVEWNISSDGTLVDFDNTKGKGGIPTRDVVILEQAGSAHLGVDNAADEFAVRPNVPSAWIPVTNSDATVTGLRNQGWEATKADANGNGYTIFFERDNGDLIEWDVNKDGVFQGTKNFKKFEEKTVVILEQAGSAHLGVDNAADEFAVRPNVSSAWIPVTNSDATVTGLRNQGWEATKADANGNGYTIFFERDNGDLIEWDVNKDGVFQGTKNFKKFEEKTVVILEQAGSAHLGVDNAADEFAVRPNALSAWIPVTESGATVTGLRNQGWEATKADANGNGNGYTIFFERDNGDLIEWNVNKDGVFQGTKNFKESEEDTVVITEQTGTAHLGVDQKINFFVVRKDASSEWIPIAEDRATVTEWNNRGWDATKAEANGSSFTVTLNHTDGREVEWNISADGTFVNFVQTKDEGGVVAAEVGPESAPQPVPAPQSASATPVIDTRDTPVADIKVVYARADVTKSTASGTVNDPMTLQGAINAAGKDGVIVALNGGGTFNTPGVILQEGQVLLGAGATDTLTGTKAPGTGGTVINGTSSVQGVVGLGSSASEARGITATGGVNNAGIIGKVGYTFLISGQSNASGHAFNDKFPDNIAPSRYSNAHMWEDNRAGTGLNGFEQLTLDTNDGIEFWADLNHNNNADNPDNQHGVEMYFAMGMQEILPDDFYLVKLGHGSASIEAWIDDPAQATFPTNHLPDQFTPEINHLDRLLQETRQAASTLGDDGIATFIGGLSWLQGESNAGDSDKASAYEGQLRTLLNDAAVGLGLAPGDLPVSIMELDTEFPPLAERVRNVERPGQLGNYNTIVAGQQSVASDHAAWHTVVTGEDGQNVDRTPEHRATSDNLIHHGTADFAYIGAEMVGDLDPRSRNTSGRPQPAVIAAPDTQTAVDTDTTTPEITVVENPSLTTSVIREEAPATGSILFDGNDTIWVQVRGEDGTFATVATNEGTSAASIILPAGTTTRDIRIVNVSKGGVAFYANGKNARLSSNAAGVTISFSDRDGETNFDNVIIGTDIENYGPLVGAEVASYVASFDGGAEKTVVTAESGSPNEGIGDGYLDAEELKALGTRGIDGVSSLSGDDISVLLRIYGTPDKGIAINSDAQLGGIGLNGLIADSLNQEPADRAFSLEREEIGNGQFAFSVDFRAEKIGSTALADAVLQRAAAIDGIDVPTLGRNGMTADTFEKAIDDVTGDKNAISGGDAEAIATKFGLLDATGTRRIDRYGLKSVFNTGAVFVKPVQSSAFLGIGKAADIGGISFARSFEEDTSIEIAGRRSYYGGLVVPDAVLNQVGDATDAVGQPQYYAPPEVYRQGWFTTIDGGIADPSKFKREIRSDGKALWTYSPDDGNAPTYILMTPGSEEDLYFEAFVTAGQADALAEWPSGNLTFGARTEDEGQIVILFSPRDIQFSKFEGTPSGQQEPEQSSSVITIDGAAATVTSVTRVIAPNGRNVYAVEAETAGGATGIIGFSPETPTDAIGIETLFTNVTGQSVPDTTPNVTAAETAGVLASLPSGVSSAILDALDENESAAIRNASGVALGADPFSGDAAFTAADLFRPSAGATSMTASELAAIIRPRVKTLLQVRGDLTPTDSAIDTETSAIVNGLGGLYGSIEAIPGESNSFTQNSDGTVSAAFGRNQYTYVFSKAGIDRMVDMGSVEAVLQNQSPADQLTPWVAGNYFQNALDKINPTLVTGLIKAAADFYNASRPPSDKVNSAFMAGAFATGLSAAQVLWPRRQAAMQSLTGLIQAGGELGTGVLNALQGTFANDPALSQRGRNWINTAVQTAKTAALSEGGAAMYAALTTSDIDEARTIIERAASAERIVDIFDPASETSKLLAEGFGNYIEQKTNEIADAFVLGSLSDLMDASGLDQTQARQLLSESRDFVDENSGPNRKLLTEYLRTDTGVRFDIGIDLDTLSLSQSGLTGERKLKFDRLIGDLSGTLNFAQLSAFATIPTTNDGKDTFSLRLRQQGLLSGLGSIFDRPAGGSKTGLIEGLGGFGAVRDFAISFTRDVGASWANGTSTAVKMINTTHASVELGFGNVGDALRSLGTRLGTLTGLLSDDAALPVEDAAGELQRIRVDPQDLNEGEISDGIRTANAWVDSMGANFDRARSEGESIFDAGNAIRGNALALQQFAVASTRISQTQKTSLSNPLTSTIEKLDGARTAYTGLSAQLYGEAQRRITGLEDTLVKWKTKAEELQSLNSQTSGVANDDDVGFLRLPPKDKELMEKIISVGAEMEQLKTQVNADQAELLTLNDNFFAVRRTLTDAIDTARTEFNATLQLAESMGIDRSDINLAAVDTLPPVSTEGVNRSFWTGGVVDGVQNAESDIGKGLRALWSVLPETATTGLGFGISTTYNITEMKRDGKHGLIAAAFLPTAVDAAATVGSRFYSARRGNQPVEVGPRGLIASDWVTTAGRTAGLIAASTVDFSIGGVGDADYVDFTWSGFLHANANGAKLGASGNRSVNDGTTAASSKLRAQFNYTFIEGSFRPAPAAPVPASSG